MEHGIPDQRRVNQGLLRLREKTGLPLVATNDAHYLHQDDHQAHDVLLCIGSGKKVADAERLRFDTQRVLREERARRWRRSSRTTPRRSRRTVRDRRDVRLHAEGRVDAARLRRARRLHHRELLREGDARRLRRAAPGARPAGGGGAAAPPARRLRGAARQGDRRHPPRRLLGLLPDRLGLHPLRARSGDPRRPRPRLGRREPGRLRAAHHRHRPDRERPDLRALPERGAHQPPRHRHRLLREPPGRGHRVRHAASTGATTWPRSSPSGR